VKRLVLKSGGTAAAWLWLALAAYGFQAVPQNVGALEQQVQKYLQEQKPELAIPLLQQIVSIEPGNINAHANLGVLLFFRGIYPEAMPHMRTALRLDPSLSRIQALLGIAEKRTGDLKRAQDDLEHSFASLDDPKVRMEAGLELVELHIATSQLDKALAVGTKLEAFAPQNPQVLLMHYQISRQMMYQSLLRMMMNAPDSAEIHMLIGGELGRQGERTAAISQYREAIRLNSKLPGVHYELAELLRSSPNAALNAQAEGEYKAAVRANPYDVMSWSRLGEIYSARSEFQAAEEHFTRALALQPKDSDARTGLAIVYISTNRTGEAMPLLESVVKDDPANVASHYRLSVLYRQAGRTSDAEREMDEFRHYQDVKDRLGKLYKQLAGSCDPK
jgi:tetratricopeptide (TPR) repeat protein